MSPAPNRPRSKSRTPRSHEPSLLIKGAEVITLDDEGRIGALDILVQGSSIVEVAPRIRARADRTLQAKGLVAIPGFVQCHIHTCQTLFRGMADDLELLDWLQARIWPLEGAMTAQDVGAAAALGMSELLLGGTTTILDMGTVQHTDALFASAKKMGIRYVGGKTIMDQGQGFPAGLRETTEEAVAESVRLCERWHGQAKGRLRYAFSPRFVLSASEEAMRACVAEARAREALLHTHASENAEEVQLVRARTGMGNVEYLHSIGFSGPDVLLAHCIWLSLEERKLIRETGTRVVHCPSANLKLASGIARIAEYLDEGLHVALGADGAGCNNRLDGFTEMRSAALLHKVRSGPTAMPAARALRMATRDGAAALGLHDVGAIAAGFKADLALLDLNKPHTFPPAGDLVSRVVYSARASDVRTVLVDGKIVVEDGALRSTKINGVLQQARKSGERLLRVVS